MTDRPIERAVDGAARHAIRPGLVSLAGRGPAQRLQRRLRVGSHSCRSEQQSPDGERE